MLFRSECHVVLTKLGNHIVLPLDFVRLSVYANQQTGTKERPDVGLVGDRGRCRGVMFTRIKIRGSRRHQRTCSYFRRFQDLAVLSIDGNDPQPILVVLSRQIDSFAGHCRGRVASTGEFRRP